MMPRYGLDTAATRHAYGRDMDFTHEQRSIGYDMIRFVPYFEVLRIIG